MTKDQINLTDAVLDDASSQLESVREDLSDALSHLDTLMRVKALSVFEDDLELIRSKVASANSEAHGADTYVDRARKAIHGEEL